jgi:hypothetical protein
MRARIEVFLSLEGGCWCSRHVDDPEILELFGTDTLPLPFTPEATLEDVLADVRARNPDADVVAVDLPSSLLN